MVGCKQRRLCARLCCVYLAPDANLVANGFPVHVALEEERLAGLEKAVPFLLESRLRGLGAQYESGPDNLPFALRDGHLITGQNPASATKVAELMLEAFKAESSQSFMPEKISNQM